MSDSVRPHRQKPTRFPRPWDSPGKNTGVGCHFLLQCMKVKSEREVVQSCPTLWDPVDCSLPGSSIHGIFQARVLEWGVHILILINIWNWLKNTKNYNCLSSFEVLWQNNRNWAAYKQWKLMPHIFGYWKFEIWCQNGQGRDVFWFSSCTFYVM